MNPFHASPAVIELFKAQRAGMWPAATVAPSNRHSNFLTLCLFSTLALCNNAVIEPFKAQRAGMWAAVGSIAGYYGFKEQQALRAALLQRQQELEQSEC
jgi:hypothetical protein